VLTCFSEQTVGLVKELQSIFDVLEIQIYNLCLIVQHAFRFIFLHFNSFRKLSEHSLEEFGNQDDLS
jgi:hypothetical protein